MFACRPIWLKLYHAYFYASLLLSIMTFQEIDIYFIQTRFLMFNGRKIIYKIFVFIIFYQLFTLFIQPERYTAMMFIVFARNNCTVFNIFLHYFISGGMHSETLLWLRIYFDGLPFSGIYIVSYCVFVF